jgi:hypothetical protein
MKKLVFLMMVLCQGLMVQAQEKLLVADGFDFTVRTDYTADGSMGLSRPYDSRFGTEGWENHTALALVLAEDPSAPEAKAAATPAQPVVYMTTPEGYQNVTFFSSDMQYAYVVYFSPEQQRTWVLVSRINSGAIQPLYQLSNQVELLADQQLTAELLMAYPEHESKNLDAFISLAGRLASGQYHGIGYIEK